MTETGYFTSRFAFDPKRDKLWQALWRHYFSKLISRDFTVLEIGAGYGHFINKVQCARRIAIDSWADFPRFLDPGVQSKVCDATELDFLEDASLDFVFASNIFEHIKQESLALVLAKLRKKLRANGTINILQPNYRFCYDEYFDDYTHVAVYSDRSMSDFLTANGFRVLECRPKFLPLTIKSRIPVSELMIKLYLNSPWKPLGKQMLIRACVATCE